MYFEGNAPYDNSVFVGDSGATVYYLPGTKGWGSTFGGLPTAPWSLPNHVILNSRPGFGVATKGFGFVISWATNATVVVEATTSLAAPAWSPVSTNSITYAPGSANPTNGWSRFTDPQWQNQPGRFYRLRMP